MKKLLTKKNSAKLEKSQFRRFTFLLPAVLGNFPTYHALKQFKWQSMKAIFTLFQNYSSTLYVKLSSLVMVT